MAKKIDGIVLSDKLFIELSRYRAQEPFDRKLVEAILRFPIMSGPVTNIAQYERCQVDLRIEKKKELAKNGLRRQSLEELADNNTYMKFILCDDSSTFPYVNVLDDKEKFECDVAISYLDMESRDKCEAHLKALCQRAKKIVIFDRYITEKSQEQIFEFLSRVFPHRELELLCYNFTDEQVEALQTHCEQWVIKKREEARFHDRYLLIDDELEIVLSSGLDHLSIPNSDLLYVVRRVKSQRMGIQ